MTSENAGKQDPKQSGEEASRFNPFNLPKVPTALCVIIRSPVEEREKLFFESQLQFKAFELGMTLGHMGYNLESV